MGRGYTYMWQKPILPQKDWSKLLEPLTDTSDIQEHITITWKGKTVKSVVPIWSKPYANSSYFQKRSIIPPIGPSFKARPIRHWRKQLEPRDFTNRGKTGIGMPMDRPGGQSALVYHLDYVLENDLECKHEDSLHISEYILKNNYAESKLKNIPPSAPLKILNRDKYNPELVDRANPKVVCTACNAEANVIKSGVVNFNENYSDNTRSYLESRCKTFEKNILGIADPDTITNYPNGKITWPDDTDKGPQIRLAASCYRKEKNNIKNKDSCKYKIIYKPNNVKFGKQGGVSSSSRIQRLKYDRLTNDGSQFMSSRGSEETNNGTFLFDAMSQYFIKNKYQAFIVRRKQGNHSNCFFTPTGSVGGKSVPPSQKVLKPTPPPPPQKYTCGIVGTPTEGQCLPDPKGLLTFDECPRCRGPATGCSNCDADSPCYDDATGYCHAANDDKSCGAGTQNCLEANGPCKACRDNDFTCYRLNTSKSEGNQLSCKNNTDFTAYIGDSESAAYFNDQSYQKCPDNYKSVLGAECKPDMPHCDICTAQNLSSSACFFDEDKDNPYCINIPTNTLGGCAYAKEYDSYDDNQVFGQRCDGGGCYLCTDTDYPCGSGGDSDWVCSKTQDDGMCKEGKDCRPPNKISWGLSWSQQDPSNVTLKIDKYESLSGFTFAATISGGGIVEDNNMPDGQTGISGLTPGSSSTVRVIATKKETATEEKNQSIKTTKGTKVNFSLDFDSSGGPSFKAIIKDAASDFSGNGWSFTPSLSGKATVTPSGKSQAGVFPIWDVSNINQGDTEKLTVIAENNYYNTSTASITYKFPYKGLPQELSNLSLKTIPYGASADKPFGGGEPAGADAGIGIEYSTYVDPSFIETTGAPSLPNDSDVAYTPTELTYAFLSTPAGGEKGMGQSYLQNSNLGQKISGTVTIRGNKANGYNFEKDLSFNSHAEPPTIKFDEAKTVPHVLGGFKAYLTSESQSQFAKLPKAVTTPGEWKFNGTVAGANVAGAKVDNPANASGAWVVTGLKDGVSAQLIGTASAEGFVNANSGSTTGTAGNTGDLVLKNLGGQGETGLAAKIDSVLGFTVDPINLWIINATSTAGTIQPSDTGTGSNAEIGNTQYAVNYNPEDGASFTVLTLTANTQKNGGGSSYTGSIYGRLSNE